MSSVSTYLWPCPARIALIEVCGGGLIAQMIRGLLLLDDSLWRPPADSIHYTLLRQADARHIQMYGATNFSSGTTHLKAFSPVSVLRLSKRRLQGDCGRCRIHGSSVGDDKHCSQLTVCSLTTLLIVVLSLLVFGVVLLSGTWAQSDGGVFMVSL